MAGKAAGIFNFKQFSVDQSGCAMKINTDGVLLGALTDAYEPKTILDIGTGTGVIALMLAQRFPHAKINAVEIDETAAATACRNFGSSAFADRMEVYPMAFETFFYKYPDKRYDLIVSNPPFFLNSLESPGAGKNLARHTNDSFFERLIKYVATHLTENGSCAMILPLETAALVKQFLPANQLHLQGVIEIKSYQNVVSHREIVILVRQGGTKKWKKLFVIYEKTKMYSTEYQKALKDFFTIF